MADDDEKFYDAFDDTVQLINSLNIGVSSDNTATSSPSFISTNELDNKNLENHSTDSTIDTDNVDVELETPWTLWFDRYLFSIFLNTLFT